MTRIPIKFFNENIYYDVKQKIILKKWINQVIENEGRKLKELNFILCSDSYLLEINQQFLKHSTYTDVITFDNSEKDNRIQGDIFISIDRIIENALKYKVNEADELHRVLIHGTLHLLGYRDKPKANKNIMTAIENKYLALRTFR